MRTTTTDPTKAPTAQVFGEVSLADVAQAAGCPTPAYLLDVASKAGVKVTVLQDWRGLPAVSTEDAFRLRGRVSAWLEAHLEKNRLYQEHLRQRKLEAAAERQRQYQEERLRQQEQNKQRGEAWAAANAAHQQKVLADQEAARRRREGDPPPFEEFDPSKGA